MTYARRPRNVTELRKASRNGALWSEAPLPRRWHRCSAWTVGATGGIAKVERCACGAIRLDGDSEPWMNRNSRRRPK